LSHYLLTGAAGFIASRVAGQLLRSGHTVYGIDEMNDAYAVEVKRWRLDRLRPETGFEFAQVDISDREALNAALETATRGGRKFDAVINLAARAGVRESTRNPWVYFNTNLTGTLNLLEYCRNAGVKKFVLASTSSLYGVHNPQPYVETANVDRPLSAYAASKRAAEGQCFTHHHLFGLDVSIMRYFTVYGPAGRPDMSMFRFIKWIAEGVPLTVFGDASQSRDFTYVDDVARGTIAALRPTGFEVINLGSDRPVVLRDMITLIEKQLGKKAVLTHVPLDPSDMPATWANIGKAERLLDWRPQVSFEDGVAECIAWYRANESWVKGIDCRA
jgi:UDP-glucuronate 4-epimerase